MMLNHLNEKLYPWAEKSDYPTMLAWRDHMYQKHGNDIWFHGTSARFVNFDSNFLGKSAGGVSECSDDIGFHFSKGVGIPYFFLANDRTVGQNSNAVGYIYVLKVSGDSFRTRLGDPMCWDDYVLFYNLMKTGELLEILNKDDLEPYKKYIQLYLKFQQALKLGTGVEQLKWLARYFYGKAKNIRMARKIVRKLFNEHDILQNSMINHGYTHFLYSNRYENTRWNDSNECCCVLKKTTKQSLSIVDMVPVRMQDTVSRRSSYI
tara:strand:- start:2216 stop:3004 length:789 start_codon:yes stop_codon:yes gene_type:complete